MHYKQRIGYVGLGLMGLPMVRRLVSLDYPVRAYDIVAEKASTAAALAIQPTVNYDALGRAGRRWRGFGRAHPCPDALHDQRRRNS